MKYDYKDFRTDELFEESRAIAKVLLERQEREEMGDECCDKVWALASLFNLDSIRRRYTLEIGEENSSFYVDWHTPESSLFKSYRSIEGESVIPDESLLERAPARWLENLLLGVYKVKSESY